MSKRIRKHFLRYLPWYSSIPDLETENKEEDNWMNYIHRNLHPHFGEESPFPGSEWSYTKRESVFDREETTDFELHQNVVDALYECKDLDASMINVHVINGVVILSGYVTTEYQKSLALETVQNLSGIWNVRNEIRIDTEAKSSWAA